MHATELPRLPLGMMYEAFAPVLRPRFEAARGVINGLRQQSPEIDAVGRGQLHLRAHAGVEEGLLHQPLAVVERAAHREAHDIVAPAGELLLLRG